MGCGRSGTSIFGEFFKDIKGFDYYSEPYMDIVMDLDVSNSIALKVPRETASYPADEGLSIPVEQLVNKLENKVQIFWIVRHPLDTICSLKVGIDKNWGHHPRPSDWEDWLEKPLLVKCAYHWNYINSIGYQKVKNIAKVVHFEDLILDTKKFVESIEDLVQIDRKENRESILKWIKRVQNENNKNFIEAETSKEYSRTDHKKRVGRWEENLNKEEIKHLWNMVEEISKPFGYSVDKS